MSASWKAHSGSVWRLSWAHPEFGTVLATCSFDRTVSVWEETIGEKPTPTMTPVKRWVRRTSLVDSRTSVTDCKFGPKSQGLVLATCSADGIIRIYEAPDIMNLSQWTLAYDVACKMPLSCLTWNHSMFRLHAPMIAVCILFIFEGFGLLNWKKNVLSLQAGSDEVQSIGGNNSRVFLFEYSIVGNGKWAKTESINVSDPVHDISFAPNVGRSYHILAIASKDLHIYSISPSTYVFAMNFSSKICNNSNNYFYI